MLNDFLRYLNIVKDLCKSYQCPKCNHQLCDDKRINLETRRVNGDLGTLFLSIDLGVFTYDHEPAVFFEKGEMVQLNCPVCDSNLSSDRFKGFSKVICELESGATQEVYISNEAGKRKLYVLTDSGLTSFQEK